MRRTSKDICRVLVTAALLLLAARPARAQVTFRGRLLGSSANLRIEIARYSSAEEIRTFEQHLSLNDIEGFFRAFRSAKVASIRYTGGEGLNIVFNAAWEKPTEKGLRITLLTESRSIVPGYKKATMKGLAFLAVVLDLDEDLNGEGVAYEDADVRISTQDVEVLSSFSVPKKIVPVQIVGGARGRAEARTDKAAMPTDRGTSLGRSDALVRRALDGLDFMLYEEAVSLFEEALAKDPAQPGLRTKQAYALYRLNETDKAVAVLNKALEVRPDDLPALDFLCFLESKAGRAADAEKTAWKFLAALDAVRKKTKADGLALDSALRELFPNAGIPAYVLALQAKKNKDTVTARSWLIQAKELAYPPLDCWVQAIDAEMARETWSQALRLCQSGGDLSMAGAARPATDAGAAVKTPFEVLILMGKIYAELGRPAESLETLKAAVALRPFDAAALKNLAIASLNQGERPAAARLLQRVLRLDPADGQAQVLLEKAQDTRPAPEGALPLPLSRDFVDERFGVRYRYAFEGKAADIADKVNGHAMNLIKGGLIPEAARWLQSFVDISEGSPTIAYNLGQLYNSLGAKTAAITYGLKAVELKRDYREANDLVANVLFKIGDFENAAKFYEAVVRLDAGDPLSHFNLGCAYAELGELAKAEKSWLTALQLENTLPAEGQAGATKKGELEIDVNVRVEPVSALALQSLGTLYAGQGKKDEALTFFQKAIELSPRVAQPYFEAGKVLLERGDAAKAKEHFDKYLALGGDEAKVKALEKKEA
jgi:tetratricopeptide (TPR) repeat protein